MNENDIAIVGMGCVLPGAMNLKQYWRNIINGFDAIEPVPAGRMNGEINLKLSASHESHLPCSHGGFLPAEYRFDPVRYGILPKNLVDGDPDQFLAIAVIDEALADAGVGPDSPLRERCDVILGRVGYPTNKMCEGYTRIDLMQHLLAYMSTRFPSLTPHELDELAADMRSHMPPDSGADSSATSMSNLAASRAANRLNLRGAAYLVDAACASSLLAVEHAVLRLRSGKCELAIAGGIQLCQTPTFWYVFKQLGALAKSNVTRPFDRRADGLLIGEGGGAVALKRLADALRDEDHIYALIRGVGSASDGHSTALLTPSSAGQLNCLENAYRDAELDRDTIGYLEAHGTGTVVGDPVEVETIKSFFGRSSDHPPHRAMGSVKSMIGHTMSTAGIASLIRTALALCHKVIPPSLHCEQPIAGLNDAPFFINSHARPWIHPRVRHPRRGGVNSFGFGGINVHAILEEVPETGQLGLRRRPFQDLLERETELLVFSGNTKTELVDRLDRLVASLESHGSRPLLAEVAATTCGEFDKAAPCKLALTCRDWEQLEQQLSTCRERLSHPEPKFDDDQSIAFSEHADSPPGKIAVIFPGTGFPGLIGNFPDHLMSLSMHFPEVRAQFDMVELRDEHPEDPTPTSILFSPPATLPSESRLALRQRLEAPKVIADEESHIGADASLPNRRSIALGAVVTSTWVSWVLLKKLHLPVDMVCGQSVSDISALCAAGVLAVDDVMPLLWKALGLVPEYKGKGRMAFAMASEEQLAPWLSRFSTIDIAMHIAPNMLVLAGQLDQLSVLLTEIRQQGLTASFLPFPPVHTAHNSFIRDELHQFHYAPIEFHPPQVPMYSSITEQPFPTDVEGMRETSMLNIDHAVRIWQTIGRLYDDGARVFIQAGNGGLTSTLKSTPLAKDAVVAQTDQDHRDPITQLNHLCATLLTSGVPIDPGFLHVHRGFDPLGWNAPHADAPRAEILLPLRLNLYPFGERIAQKALENLEGSQEGMPDDAEGQSVEDPAGTSIDISMNDRTSVNDGGGRETHSSEGKRSASSGTDDDIRLPFLGQIEEFVEGQEITNVRVLDLNDDVFLHDHVFINATQYKPLEECSPMLPMAMIMEALAETAACLAPGLGLIGLENLRALRWVAFQDATLLPICIKARVESRDEHTGVVAVQAEMFSEGHLNAAATLLLGSAYPRSGPLEFSELRNPRSWVIGVDEVYRDRHAFHGPRLQSVTDLIRIGDQGGEASLTIMPTDDLFRTYPHPELLLDPITMDGVAQLLGLWSLCYDKYSLPNGIRRLKILRPPPPRGTKVPVRLEFTRPDLDNRILVSNVEVQDGSGNVWMQIEGFTQWVFNWTRRAIDAQRMPQKFSVSAEKPYWGANADTVVTVLREEDIAVGNFEWATRLCLTHREMHLTDRLATPRRQWQWLRGRLAAKDAVRAWLAREYSIEMIHPLAIAILYDNDGRPYAELDEGLPDPPFISIAHSDGTTIAAASRSYVGVDVEPAGSNVEEILHLFCRDSETRLIDNLILTQVNSESRVSWFTRLWCAKEAVGKSLGTGLAGRPRDFEAIDVERDGQFLIQHHPSGYRFVAMTHVDGEMVLAQALVQEAVVNTAAASDPA